MSRNNLAGRAGTEYKGHSPTPEINIQDEESSIKKYYRSSVIVPWGGTSFLEHRVINKTTMGDSDSSPQVLIEKINSHRQ